MWSDNASKMTSGKVGNSEIRNKPEVKDGKY